MGRGGIHLGTEYGNQTMKKDLGMNVGGPASLAMRGLRGNSVRQDGQEGGGDQEASARELHNDGAGGVVVARGRGNQEG